MTIPVLDLGPDPEMRGRIHGQKLKGDIRHNIEIYLTRFDKLGFNADKVLEEAGRWIAPLNKDGKALYLAVNCPARKINTTGTNGSWKTWGAPQQRFEHDLVKDLCKAKGG